jgi:hypothetical protein
MHIHRTPHVPDQESIMKTRREQGKLEPWSSGSRRRLLNELSFDKGATGCATEVAKTQEEPQTAKLGQTTTQHKEPSIMLTDTEGRNQKRGSRRTRPARLGGRLSLGTGIGAKWITSPRLMRSWDWNADQRWWAWKLAVGEANRARIEVKNPILRQHVE